MLYYLSFLKSAFFGFNVFSYITFRSGGAALTAFLVSLFFGSWIIERLIQWGLVHRPKVWGPQLHERKTGVPVGGGLLILLALLTATALWARPTNRFVLLGEMIVLIFGVIGFWDDWAKIKGERRQGKAEGLSSRMKFLVQVSVAAILAFYLAVNPSNPLFPLQVNVPFFKEFYLSLGVLYFFLLMIFFVGFTNSVNLADGLDGLAIGNLAITAAGMIVFVYVAGHAKFSQYLKVIPVPEAGELTVVLAAVIGASLGFLWFNANPAQVFMGDTGSLPLGALLVYVSIVAKQELLLPILGGVFIIEALSVIIQIVYFKLTGGRRYFKMSPLHHHFELGGVPEQKIVIRFWIAGIILTLIALSSLKVR